MPHQLKRGVVALAVAFAVSLLTSGYVSGQATRPGHKTLVVVIKEHVFQAKAPNDPQRTELLMKEAQPTQYELDAGRDWVFCENGGEVGVLGVLPVVYTAMDGYKPIPSISRKEEALMKRDNKILADWLLGRVGAMVSRTSLQKDLSNCEAWLRENREKHEIRYRLARAAVYSKHEKYDQARQELKKALKLDPDNQFLRRVAQEDR